MSGTRSKAGARRYPCGLASIQKFFRWSSTLPTAALKTMSRNSAGNIQLGCGRMFADGFCRIGVRLHVNTGSFAGTVSSGSPCGFCGHFAVIEPTDGELSDRQFSASSTPYVSPARRASSRRVLETNDVVSLPSRVGLGMRPLACVLCTSASGSRTAARLLPSNSWRNWSTAAASPAQTAPAAANNRGERLALNGGDGIGYGPDDCKNKQQCPVPSTAHSQQHLGGREPAALDLQGGGEQASTQSSGSASSNMPSGGLNRSAAKRCWPAGCRRARDSGSSGTLGVIAHLRHSSSRIPTESARCQNHWPTVMLTDTADGRIRQPHPYKQSAHALRLEARRRRAFSWDFYPMEEEAFPGSKMVRVSRG